MSEFFPNDSDVMKYMHIRGEGRVARMRSFIVRKYYFDAISYVDCDGTAIVNRTMMIMMFVMMAKGCQYRGVGAI